MIIFKNIENSKPYKTFKKLYDKAYRSSQENIEAVSIASYNPVKKEVSSRYVNIKYIINNRWIFFSNYNSPKANDFYNHPQSSMLIFWPSINYQIRLNGKINKSSEKFSDEHFAERNMEKNILAIISNQSKTIDNYDLVKKKFLEFDINKKNIRRPSYWGGFEFQPTSFEFWEGKKYRLNRRSLYKKNDDGLWEESFLEP